MGVKGLLPMFKNAYGEIDLHDFMNKGLRVAIDGYGWLHRGAFSCAKELSLNPQTDRIVSYMISNVGSLEALGIHTITVFDGKSMSTKDNTIEKRKQEREEAKRMAQSLESRGQFREAFPYWQRSVSITFETVSAVIKEMKKYGYEYYVSPNEADSQMAYLARNNYVDAVITEDSDLVVYQTPLVLFKYDPKSMRAQSLKYPDALRAIGLNTEQLIVLAILVGCDYLDHVNKVGMKAAMKIVTTTTDLESVYRILKSGYEVPEDYLSQMSRAADTFRYQWAYDPKSKSMVTLTPTSTIPSFMGAPYPDSVLIPLVKGDIGPSDAKLIHNSESQPEISTVSVPVSPYFSMKL